MRDSREHRSVARGRGEGEPVLFRYPGPGGILRQAALVQLRRRTPQFHGRLGKEGGDVERRQVPADSMLRPPVPGMVQEQGRLRRDALRGELACTEKICMGLPAEGQGNREPVLRCSGKQGGLGPVMQL